MSVAGVKEENIAIRWVVCARSSVYGDLIMYCKQYNLYLTCSMINVTFIFLIKRHVLDMHSCQLSSSN